MAFLAVLERSWVIKSNKIGRILTIYRFFLFQEQVSHEVVKGGLLTLKEMGRKVPCTLRLAKR
jgi:hypothetical protein